MLNKVFLMGNLGKDPVVKHFSNDNAIAEFSLATSSSYKDKEGKWVDQTEWHNIKIPTKRQAETAEKYLKKGSKVFIEGTIRTRKYQDKDGKDRYITEIVAESFKMLDKKEGSGGGGNYSQDNSGYDNYSQSSNSQDSGSSSAGVDDDLPF